MPVVAVDPQPVANHRSLEHDRQSSEIVNKTLYRGLLARNVAHQLFRSHCRRLLSEMTLEHDRQSSAIVMQTFALRILARNLVRNRRGLQPAPLHVVDSGTYENVFFCLSHLWLCDCFSGIDNDNGGDGGSPVGVLGDANDGDDPPVAMIDDDDDDDEEEREEDGADPAPIPPVVQVCTITSNRPKPWKPRLRRSKRITLLPQNVRRSERLSTKRKVDYSGMA